MRSILFPTTFSVLAWLTAMDPHTASQAMNFFFWRISSTYKSSVVPRKDLTPKTLIGSYQLGHIAARLREAKRENNKMFFNSYMLQPFRGTSISTAHLPLGRRRTKRDKDIIALLAEAKEILQVEGHLTIDDVTEGVAKAAQNRDVRGGIFKRYLGTVSFLGVLSFISIIGILATLLPTLTLLWETFRLDRLWSIVAPYLKGIVEPTLYIIPLLVFIASFNFPKSGGARAQVAILAAVLAFIPFYFYSIRKYELDSEVLIFLWSFSFLVPLALGAGSSVLGFFSVGAIFGMLGFVAMPMPFGWQAGFLNEASMNRSMFASFIIISISLATKVLYLERPEHPLSIFETGGAVFGMLAFGLAGLIKSNQLSSDDHLFFGGATSPKALVYPISWILLGYLGFLLSYQSLANTAITFVGLWISQFYWRLAGLNAASVFIASIMLYGMTLWLKSYPEYIVSLFKI